MRQSFLSSALMVTNVADVSQPESTQTAASDGQQRPGQKRTPPPPRSETQDLHVATRRTPDLEESEAIQHFNVYFTHHFIPMDLKSSPADTTGVPINTLTSIMSNTQNGQIRGGKWGGGGERLLW